MTDQTNRLKMPYIKQSQSQKEVTHNAGLDLLDFYLNPVIEDHTLSVPPAASIEGKMWIVALNAVDDWAGQEDQIAYFIHGSWRFFTPFEGQTVWLKQPKYHAIFVNNLWEYGIMRGNEVRIWGQTILANRGGVVANAVGGTIIDIEARTAINQLLSICKAHGMLET